MQQPKPKIEKARNSYGRAPRFLVTAVTFALLVANVTPGRALPRRDPRDGSGEGNPSPRRPPAPRPPTPTSPIPSSVPITTPVYNPGGTLFSSFTFDVKKAFENVDEKKPVRGNIHNRFVRDMPYGYTGDRSNHQQGIQKLMNGGYVVSGSTPKGNASYFYTTDAARNVLKVTRIKQGEYSHAGGFQVYGNLMAIGVEGSKGGGSQVHFYDLSDPSNPRELALVIKRATETAGAVGLTRTGDDYLCVVGNYGTEKLDFYRFQDPNIKNDNLAPHVSRQVPNRDWKGYQNLNLFTDHGQNLWIVGMHTNFIEPALGQDWADLWKVSLVNNVLSLSKEGKKHHESHEEKLRFAYGAGYCYNLGTGRFEVLCIAEHMDGNGNSRGALWTANAATPPVITPRKS